MVGRAGEPKGSPGPFQPVLQTLYVSPPQEICNSAVVINLTEKVNHMNTVSTETITPITHNAIPVITTELLARLYGTDPVRIRQGYKRNADRFVCGKHYFKVEGKELADLRVSLSYSQNPVSPKVRSLILWTERGAARHAKMLETDQAWEVFEKLEDCYFAIKSPADSMEPITSPAFNFEMYARNAKAACTHMAIIREAWLNEIHPSLKAMGSPLAERLYDRILDAVTIIRVVSDGLERVSLRKGAGLTTMLV